MKKTCTRCNQELSLEYFYRNKSKPDGRTSHCKQCVRTRSRHCRNKARERRREYKKRNAHKNLSHSAVNSAIVKGVITRPPHCNRCKKTCKPEAHHWSYKPEHRLDVKWWCRDCHKEYHRIAGKLGTA